MLFSSTAPGVSSLSEPTAVAAAASAAALAAEAFVRIDRSAPHSAGLRYGPGATSHRSSNTVTPSTSCAAPTPFSSSSPLPPPPLDGPPPSLFLSVGVGVGVGGSTLRTAPYPRAVFAPSPSRESSEWSISVVATRVGECERDDEPPGGAVVALALALAFERGFPIAATLAAPVVRGCDVVVAVGRSAASDDDLFDATDTRGVTRQALPPADVGGREGRSDAGPVVVITAPPPLLSLSSMLLLVLL